MLTYSNIYLKMFLLSSIWLHYRRGSLTQPFSITTFFVYFRSKVHREPHSDLVIMRNFWDNRAFTDGSTTQDSLKIFFSKIKSQRANSLLYKVSSSSNYPFLNCQETQYDPLAEAVYPKGHKVVDLVSSS